MIKSTLINGLRIIPPERFLDNRGFFSVVYNTDKLIDLGMNILFSQVNNSYNKNSLTFRGMHYQMEPFMQNKIVTCLSGSIIDIVVDLRKNSSSYLSEEYVILSANSGEKLLVPTGCAHGFLTLEENTIVSYLIDERYSPEYEVSFNFKSLRISNYININKLTISEKDSEAPLLKEVLYD